MAMQRWGVSGEGGYLASPELSNEVRIKAANKCTFRQFVRVQEDFGAQKGESIYFTKVGKLDNTGITTPLSEVNPVPTTNLAISRSSVTVNEYGRKVEWTKKLETLEQISIEDIIESGLFVLMTEMIDALAAVAFRATDYYYTPTGTTFTPSATFSTTGAAGATATRNMQMWDTRQIGLRFKILNVPTYDGRNYMCISTPLGMYGIREDNQWRDDARWGKPENLFNGELGIVENIRFVDETNVLNGALAGGLGEQIYFGWDPVIEAVALYEELRMDFPVDMGRKKAMGFLGIFGWEPTWDFGDDGETRTIRVSSL